MGLLEDSEDEVKKLLEALLVSAGEQLLPKLGAMLDAKWTTNWLPDIEAAGEKLVATKVAGLLGVNEADVQKSLTDVFNDKLAALPGDFIQLVKDELPHFP